MNLKFSYLYRDAGNFKSWGEIVFLNPERLSMVSIQQRLEAAFDSHELFIAHQIDVPEVFLYNDGNVSANDHCFHEFGSIDSTDEATNDLKHRSISQFLADVERAEKEGWKAFDPATEWRLRIAGQRASSRRASGE